MTSEPTPNTVDRVPAHEVDTGRDTRPDVIADDVSTADAPAAMLRDRDDRRAALEADGAEGDEAMIRRTVSINRDRDELFAFWRDFSNLPAFMENLVSVEHLDDTRSRWVARGPAGTKVEWIARLTEEVPGELLAWESEPGADVDNRGKVVFRDNAPGRGVAVTAMIAYDPPGGLVGRAIATLFQKEPGLQARRDLRRFKQLMETGEISTAARNREEAGLA